MSSRSKRRGGEQSANHLLNFHYQELAQASGGTPPFRHQAPRDPRQHVDPATLKRAFILQTFQFVLKPEALTLAPDGARRGLESYLHDHDALVPWDWIRAVVWKASYDDFQCPICLDPPTAPRMTSCGHIFCFSCTLRHLQLQKAANKQRTCPVCHAFSGPSLLKPCVLQPLAPIAVGSMAAFTLVARESTSVLVFQRDDKAKLDASLAGVSQDALIPPYGSPSAECGRYSLATEELEELIDVMDVSGIEEKLDALRGLPRPLSNDDSGELDALQEALSRAQSQGLEGATPAGRGTASGGGGSSPGPVPSTPSSSGRHAVSASWGASPPSAQPTRVSSAALAKVAAAAPPKLVEFYCAANGQQVYLHALNTKMLQDDATARTLASPLGKLTAKVLELTTVTQTAETRSTMRALAHVPLHASYQLALVDLGGIVLPSTLATFKAALDRRLDRLASVAALEDGAGSGQLSAADALWERHKSDRLSAYGEWGLQRTPGVSPELAPMPDLATMPALELPPQSQSQRSENGGSNHVSDQGPSDSSVESRQRATKREASASSVWGHSTAGSSVVEQLFTATRTSQPPAAPSWGKKPFTPKATSGPSTPVSSPWASSSGGGGSLHTAPQRVVATSSSAFSDPNVGPQLPPNTVVLLPAPKKKIRRGDGN